MAAAMTEPTPQAPAAAQSARDDAELLQRIAEKDRAAFDELYSRYKDRVYSLIYAIVHDANDAQDALQEAFLRIWKGAGSVKHFEQIPAWILRVSAREGLRIHRLRSRKKNRMRSLDEDGGEETGKPQHEAPAPPPPGEAVLALREQVLRLDAGQQRLVALYFGGELSQAEIAEALDLTQQAVSVRIQKITERLRNGLRSAGFAAATPLLAPDVLREALVTARTAPASADASAAAHAARESRRTAGVSAGGAAPAAIAAALLLAAVITAWVYLKPASQNPPAPPAVPASPSASESPAPTGAGKPLPVSTVGVLRRWTFDNPEDTDGLTVIVGAWHYATDGKGDGYMVSDTKNVQVRIDLPVTELPVEVSFDANTEVKPSASKLVYLAVAWDRSNGIAFFHNAGTPSQKGDLVRALVAKRTVDLYLGPNRSKMLATERTGPEARLVLVLEGDSTAIDNLQLRRIAPADVPDASLFLNALDALPLEARTKIGQEFELPGLPSPQPGKKITVSFFPPSEKR